MSGQANTERLPRSARTPGDTAATKAERLRGSLANALKRISKEPLAPARTSAALLALLPRADEIRAALGRGWSANAIAEAIACEAGYEATFSVETIRTAIKRIAAESGSATRQSTGVPRPSITAATNVVPIRQSASTTVHAGFDEDPK